MVTSNRMVVVLFLFIAALACSSCEHGSSGTEIVDTPISTDDNELIGTWACWFAYGSNYELSDIDNLDADDFFAIGILTLEREARFIGDASQLVCYEGSLGVSTNYYLTKSFGGNFWFYSYDTDPAATDYSVTIDSVRIGGDTLLSNSLMYAQYRYRPFTEPAELWEIQLLNYSGEDIYPDVYKLRGTWKIADSFEAGNDLTFDISVASEEDTLGSIINGSDTNGNTLSGTIIEIRYNDPATNIPATEMYRVNLTLTVGGSATSLSGLASYIESMNSTGVTMDEALAIGATAFGGTRMVTGIASKVP